MHSRTIELFYLFFQGVLLFQVVFFGVIYYFFRRKEILYYSFLNLVTACYFFLNAPTTYFSIPEESIFTSSYYDYSNYFLILLMEFIYLIFLREIYKDCRDHRFVKKIYRYTLWSFPVLLIVFILLTTRHLKTDLVFLIGHIINGPFVGLVLFLNFKKKGYLAFIKYGMIVLFVSILVTAIFSIRFNYGFNQSKFDSYPLLFVRIGMLIDIILFQMALLQIWHEQERQLSIEKSESQLIAERIRLRISGELHDDLGASLSGISMYSHLALSRAMQGDSIVMSYLNTIKNTADELVEKLRDIVWITNPAQDSLFKLVRRLEEYADMMAKTNGMKVNVQIPDILPSLHMSVDKRRNIYLCFKEAINNATKYSHATQLDLVIEQNSDEFNISVKDNGIGFDPGEINQGNGLANMRKRAEDIGATFNVISKTTQGCEIQMRIKSPFEV